MCKIVFVPEMFSSDSETFEDDRSLPSRYIDPFTKIKKLFLIDVYKMSSSECIDIGEALGTMRITIEVMGGGG